MKTITPTQFLEQMTLGAQVQPFDGAFQLGVQVGHHQYVCELEDFNASRFLNECIVLVRFVLAFRATFA
jgi:hypothetical protein